MNREEQQPPASLWNQAVNVLYRTRQGLRRGKVTDPLLCALLAAGAPRWLIKRMLRWRGDDSLEIYARVNNEDWASWTRKMVNVAVDSSIASRLTYMDFSDEVRARFTDVAKSLLSMGSRATSRAGGL